LDFELIHYHSLDNRTQSIGASSPKLLAKVNVQPTLNKLCLEQPNPKFSLSMALI